MLTTLDHIIITDSLHTEASYLAQGSRFCATAQMINFQFLQHFTESDPSCLITFCKL